MNIKKILKTKKIMLYGNEETCKQIKYILNDESIKIVKKIENLKKSKNEIIILCYISKKERKKINKQFKYKKDYININNLYKLLNKGYLKRYKITKHNIRYIYYIIRPKFKNINIISKIKNEYLRPSEMLIKVLNSKKLKINCKNLEEKANIDYKGELWGCCPGWITIPFGNIKEDKIYNDYTSRIIKLSSLNKTYCFCNLNACKYNYEDNIQKKLKSENYPKELTISIDKSCNLKCSSCRKKFYNAKKTQLANQDEIIEKLKRTGWLEKSIIILAGQGEVFYSNSYKKILETDIKRNTIKILTNGTLLNKKNWEFISSKYNNVYISISIDAANKDTYWKLRKGNFNYLMKNLKMLGNLRKENKIKELQLNFVVQKDNYKEMKEFIKIGKENNVDKIQFTKLNNWKTFKKNEYKDKCLIIDDKYLNYELYNYLKDSIFKDEIVDLKQFEQLINNSQIYYGENNE